jgi:dTDP-4-amino-4,6-dideoxygalactose transaminase
VLTAVSRYGARVIPNTEQTIAALRAKGQLVRGPHLAALEGAFATRLGASHAIAASYGRMAFYYLLRALDLPVGSEVVFPSLTFWVVPELARVAGLTPVFADVDARTFTLDPEAFERVITPRTRVVVPTHLYGLPCDMDAILAIARRHRVAVIEDCAHALGATWRGQPVGTLGDAGFFSFQLLKPLNTYGGGMAVTNDPRLAPRVRVLAESEPWPAEAAVVRRLRLGQVQRIAIRPRVFTWSLFPALWVASYFQARPDVYLWEPIRRLDPLPAGYCERYSNVQAALGLEGLAHLDDWTARTVAHAQVVTDALRGTGVEPPCVPEGRTHVFYQYAIYAERPDTVARYCLRHGVDTEMLHVDVCTQLPLFDGARVPAPGAERAATAIQLPVHESLTDAEVERVARVVREAIVRRPGL